MPLTHQFFHLEDKLERALLRTSGVSSAEVDKGAASARLSLSDAVSPSTFASDSDSAPSCALRRGPHPKTLGAARGRCRRRQRVRERDDTPARGPREPPGAPLPGRANPDAAATLSSGGASGSRTALCLSSVMLADPGATSRQASSAAAGAGSSARVGADSARPAPPRLSGSQDPPQPGRRPWNSAPPSAAAALSPGRSTIGLFQHRPSSLR